MNETPRILVTGANGAIGQAILRNASSQELIAAVRSPRAAEQIPDLSHVTVAQIDYGDSASLERAASGATAWIHLPGVLIEHPGSSYESANVETTKRAIEASRKSLVAKFVLVSAFGANAEHSNRFYKTKGMAEDQVRESGIPYTIIRAPLVLGPGTEGTRSLVRSASKPKTRLLGGGKGLQQPLDVDDLARACLNACDPEVAENQVLELAGPEVLSDRDLVQRAGKFLGQDVQVGSIPVAPMRFLLGLRTKLFGPGFSPDVLEVILADDQIDPMPAQNALGIQLTPLVETLKRSVNA